MHLRETPSRDPRERTERNVRDSDATLILTGEGDVPSPGTASAADFARRLSRPCLVAVIDDPASRRAIERWVRRLPAGAALNVAGPRKSELPGIYVRAHSLLRRVLDRDVAP